MWQGRTVLSAAVESHEPRMVKKALDLLQEHIGDEDEAEVRL